MIGQARGLRAARHAVPVDWCLRDGLSVCLVADRAVFLDLPADRYFCLARGLEAAFRAWASGEADRAEMSRLHAQRLLEPASGLCDRIPPIRLPEATSSLLDSPARASLPTLGTTWLQLAASAVRLRRAGLARSIRRLRQRKECARSTASASDTEQIERAARIVRAHEAAALFCSSYDKCLWRSLAIATHLAAAGIAAEFVLGVRLRPFRAHSWVQIGDIAINDRVENVRTFTPILVV